MPLLLESELSLPLEPEDQPQAADTDWMGPENDRSCTKSIPKTAKERRPNMANEGRESEPNEFSRCCNGAILDLSNEKIQKFSHHTELITLKSYSSYLWPWECRLYHCASIYSAQVRTHTWLIRNPSFLGLRSTRPLPFVAVGNRHPAGCSHSLPVSPQGTDDYSHLYRRLYFSEMLEEDPADSLLSYLCCIIQVLQGSKISIYRYLL